MPLGRLVSVGLSTVFAAVLVTGCSGGPPGDASTEDFCDTWTEGRGGGTVEEVRESAADLEAVGTPEGIGDAERAGFEVFVDALTKVDQEDLEALDQAVADEASLAEFYGISEDEAADVLAFFGYTNETCSDAAG